MPCPAAPLYGGSVPCASAPLFRAKYCAMSGVILCDVKSALGDNAYRSMEAVADLGRPGREYE